MAELVDHSGDVPPFTARFRHRDGRTRWLEGDVVVRVDDAGTVVGFRSTFHDVSDRAELQKQLIDLVGLDDLTGLRNRGGFLRSAEDQLKLARRRGTPLVLLFVDVDGLKEVNDTLGHAAGDRLLESAADLLSRTFRETDLVARVGGDEFCVLLTSDASEAWLAIRRLLGAIDEHHERGAWQASRRPVAQHRLRDLRPGAPLHDRRADGASRSRDVREQAGAACSVACGQPSPA